MKPLSKTFSFLLTAFVCCAGLLFSGFTVEQDTFRVVSWNIKSGGESCYREEYALNSTDFDIALLQEVLEDPVSRYKNILDAFSEEYEKAFTETVKLDEQGYGTGILSRYDIKSVTTYDLPGQYYAEDRVLTRISVWIDHREVALYNVHLAYESDALRAEQMACIAEIFASDPLSYKVLGGDFNVRSFDEYAPFSDFLMVSNEETPFETYQKEDWDTRCLDNIIYTDTLQLVDAQMVESSLSDHYLLSASFLFADETEDF